MQKEEVLYLERVNQSIDKRIEHDQEQLDYYLEQLKVIPDDDENKFSMASVWAETYTNALESLKRHKDKPYFARIDFKADDTKEKEKLYIGKLSLLDANQDSLIIDWRTPIANLYYDSSLGSTSYKTNDNSYIHGDLSLKRVYNIEDSKLIDYMDVNSTSDDELLKPYLGVNADNKIKTIITSIQQEQNEIIRDPLYKNIIVQGVAGSGKTTVMLHRIAFLAYNYQDKYQTNQYLVVSPNKLFTDYISAILPDLEVDKVSQLTYEEIFKNYLNFKFNYKILTRNKGSDYDEVSHYKSSKTYIEKIQDYYKSYEDKILSTDITYKGIVVIDKDYIKSLYPYSTSDPLDVKINKLIDYLYSSTQKDSYNLIRKINNQISLLNQTHPEKVKENMDLSFEIKQFFIKGAKQLIKNHFKTFDFNIYKLYKDFVSTLDEESIKETTLINLEKKQFDYDDLPALIYLKYLVNGAKLYDSFISVNVDEAQDLGYTHYFALKTIFRRAYFTIVGDLSQSIYAYRGIESWDDINNLFENDLKYLNKSYRNTIEIMNYANVILRHLNVKEALPVIRHGNPVNEIKYQSKIEEITKRINHYKDNYNSIAIITKTKKEVDYLYDKLKKLYSINKIDEDTIKLENGISILPAYLSKGLEFDCVILVDVDDNNYNINNILDLKLLYVGITRALHNLDILYSDKKQILYRH